MSSSSREKWVYPLLIVVAAAVATFFWGQLVLDQTPFEDAAILLRYAVNLANGHGLVWNPGGGPVDGGSDFLATLGIAALIRSGLDPATAVRLLGLAFHLLTAALIFHTVRAVQGSSRLIALTTAVYFLIGPGLNLISAGFATPIFAFIAALTWFFALDLMRLEEPERRGVAFALSALVLSLTRFEGVLLAGLMLMSVAAARRGQIHRRLAAAVLVIFVFGFGFCFLCHWSYFGHPLPLPYYQLASGRLHPTSLSASLLNTARLAGPFSLPFFLGLWNPKTERQAALMLLPVLGFALIWILVSSSMNYLMRFQYPLLPIILMSWYPLVKDLGWDGEPDERVDGATQPARRASLAQFAMCLLVLAYAMHISGTAESYQNSNREVAKSLKPFADRHVLATTEAGVLPLYSGWTTIDTWGLNDPWIAMHGGIDEGYLDSHPPDVILTEGPFEVASGDYGLDELNGPWKKMVQILKCYARKNRYIVAGAFGASPYSATTFYVRPGRDSDAIVSAIRAVHFSDVESGGTLAGINYATASKPGHEAAPSNEKSPTADVVEDRSVQCEEKPEPASPATGRGSGDFFAPRRGSLPSAHLFARD